MVDPDCGGPELFAISPGRGDRLELLDKLPALAAGGLQRFLLREKQLSPAARLALAGPVCAACRELGVECWIAEDVSLAIAVQAEGVHLSEASPSPRWLAHRNRDLALGVSLHEPLSRTFEEVAACRHAFLGPLFPTPSKPDANLLPLATFVKRCGELPIPLFALGGIGETQLEELAAAGIHRVAAIRLFFEARDPEAAVRRARERLVPRSQP